MNYILEEMNKLNADGVDFIPLSEAFFSKEYYKCKIIESYTKEQIKLIKSIPKTGRLYWKIVNGKKEYINVF